MDFNTSNNTNYNFKNNASDLSAKERLAMMSNDEKFNVFAPNAAKLLAEKSEYEVPENGQFSKACVSFKIPGTQNIAYYIVEHDVLEPKNQRRFSIASARDGSDRLTSVNLFKGTKKEILEYLNDNNNAQLFRDTLRQVSDSVDDYYSSY